MKSIVKVIIIAIVCSTSIAAIYAPTIGIFQAKNGQVKFTSEAPLEIIKASSNRLIGLINTENNNFAFTIPITSFMGFNSELQREHFNENYMETSKYSKAKFVGTIQENVDFNTNGKANVTAKGKLSIHGVTKERTINATLSIQDGAIKATSTFDVPLEDHDIDIPKIVDRKIAEVISVEVKATFNEKK